MKWWEVKDGATSRRRPVMRAGDEVRVCGHELVVEETVGVRESAPPRRENSERAPSVGKLARLSGANDRRVVVLVSVAVVVRERDGG